MNFNALEPSRFWVLILCENYEIIRRRQKKINSKQSIDGRAIEEKKSNCWSSSINEMILPRRPCKVSQLIYKIVNFICILQNSIESNLAISRWLAKSARKQQLPEALLMLLNAHQKSTLKLFRARVRISARIALSRSETSKKPEIARSRFYRS